MFIDRKPRKDDPWLAFKVGAFSAGAVLAMAGIYLRERWLIWAAIGVLMLGFAARFFGASGEEGGEEGERSRSG